jgi:hypothetical protein
MASTYSKINRYKEFIKWFILHYKPKCCFCGKPLSYESFYPKLSGKKRDNLTIHHWRYRPYEVTDLCHRSCHRKYHRNQQLKKVRKRK